jgi:hypothetical protein
MGGFWHGYIIPLVDRVRGTCSFGGEAPDPVLYSGRALTPSPTPALGLDSEAPASRFVCANPGGRDWLDAGQTGRPNVGPLRRPLMQTRSLPGPAVHAALALPGDDWADGEAR